MILIIRIYYNLINNILYINIKKRKNYYIVYALNYIYIYIKFRQNRLTLVINNKKCLNSHFFSLRIYIINLTFFSWSFNVYSFFLIDLQWIFMYTYNFLRFKRDIFFIDSYKKIKNHDFFLHQWLWLMIIFFLIFFFFFHII